MDQLRELQAAVREMLLLEHQINERTHMDLAAVNTAIATLEAKLHKARQRVQRLAGIDEVD